MPGRGIVIAAFEYPCMTINEIIQYISVILLFTQAPTPARLDGTIVDSRNIFVTMYYCGYVGV